MKRKIETLKAYLQKVEVQKPKAIRKPKKY